MYCFSVVYNNKICNLSDVFNKRFQAIKHSINIDSSSYEEGNETIIEFKVNDENIKDITEIKRIVKDYIADGIAETIISKYQYVIIKKQLISKDIYFTQNDIKDIFNKTLEIINKNENGERDLLTYKINKRAKIFKILLDYLENNNSINIEGFINFRLRFLIEKINEAVEKVVEDLVVEKEFEEFIKMLKYFVDIQSPKVETVNIFFLKDKKYLLYDKDMKLINNDYLKEIAKEMYENDMSYDDLLISSLITIAPRKLILHTQQRKGDDIIKIISSIFNDRVDICSGCNLCTLDNRLNFIKRD